MRQYTKQIPLLMVLLLTPALMMAQMSIDEFKPREDTRSLSSRDSVRKNQISQEYYSAAREKAIRDSIRNERNTLEIISSLQGSLTSYNDPWIETSGGDNTTAILGSFKLTHSYKKDKMTITSKVTANLGMNRIKIDTGTDDDGNTINEGVWFKNQDEISISVAPTFAISSIWSYGPSVSFRTQFADGYVSRSQQESYQLKSGFMAPGYLDVSGGVTYKCPVAKLPFTINIAPVSLSATYVSNEYVKNNFLYGFAEDQSEDNWGANLEPYGVSYLNNSKYEGGSSIQIDFDRTFDKVGKIRYTTTLYSFYGWMTQASYKNIINNYDDYLVAQSEWDSSSGTVQPMLGIQPTVRWENTISIPATDVLSTTIKFQLYYNRAQSLKLQTQTYLSVGLSYTYKNK